MQSISALWPQVLKIAYLVQLLSLNLSIAQHIIDSTVPSVTVAAQLTEENFTSAFPIVCTRNGCIEGIAQPGYQIDEYEAFFGIPYAEPPVGDLRFAVSNIRIPCAINFK